ncbi:carbohydrate ABC transporter substrate-binding protein [Cohnella luojiensis]|uniref:Carbohydrate ABC transporter substrate-binding protein n=2 Tax=Cohnella luojiensis TaxID=652876 RepID=A0A4Y8LSU2_9BACL|nr:ABC transporter substrate-binding protein [Cohnella luojiensis]TFE19784.1 carbohydrate ABC transporter substrate-binding protein [Cohnella luojiensis]
MMLLGAMLAACGAANNENAAPGATGTATQAPVKNATIKIFQFKVEIAEALDKLKEAYESEHPGIKLNIETVGGGSDYGAALKAKFTSGDEPDIFNNGGFNELNTWQDRIEDVSDQPWVADTLDVAKEPMSKDGKLFGMPMNLEGYGFIYNKDMFQKAGITNTPKTLTELKDACAKLKAAGMTPFANGYGEWWILGIHNFNVAVAQHDNPMQWVADRNAGKVKIAGDKIFEDWANMLDLTLENGNKNPLTTDYNTQVTLFASGETAMMQQGNWTQVQIDKITPNMNLGVLPMPINDDAEKNDKLFAGVPSNWVVNKNSKVKEEAKEFLNWLVTSEVGKDYIVNQFKFIPAFKSIEVKDEKTLGPIAGDVMAYSTAGKTLSWNWFNYPDGMTNELGAAIQSYVKKRDRASMFKEMDKQWDRLAKK